MPRTRPPYLTIEQGLNEAIGHAKGTQAGVKVGAPLPWTWRLCVVAWGSRRLSSRRGSACRWPHCGTGSVATAARKGQRLTVSKWRARFVELRLDGLLDAPRPGAPRTIDDSRVDAVVAKTLESAPKGATHWSTRLMAREVGMSQSAVSRIWRGAERAFTCNRRTHHRAMG